jgi:hypothetical protein
VTTLKNKYDNLCKVLNEQTAEMERLRRAFEYALVFVHLDIRDKALQIARGEDQPGAEHENPGS